MRRQLSQKEAELKASQESSLGLTKKVEELQGTLNDPRFLHAMGAFYVREFLNDAMELLPDSADRLKEASRDFISSHLKFAPPSPVAAPDSPVAEDEEVPEDEAQGRVDP